MTELVSYTLGPGEKVVVEVDSGDRPQPASKSGKVRDLGTDFAAHLDSIRLAARATLGSFRDDLRPDGIKLSLGIKLTAEAGAVIAKSALEGNLILELTWRSPSETNGDSDAGD